MAGQSAITTAALAILVVLGGCSFADKNDKNDPNTGKSPLTSTASPRKAIDPAAMTPPMRHARLALDCIHKQYPNKISHVLNSADDAREPRELTPAFYGCYDWHSAVHGHWMLLRLWGRGDVPEMDGEIRDALSRSFTKGNIAGELAYFQGVDRYSFERPYGMAWFLQLTVELDEISKGTGPKAEQAKAWVETLTPLENQIVRYLKDWLPKLAYPIRSGTHNQSAFAFGLMLDWARDKGDSEMEKLVVDTALRFHQDDKNCPIGYEPSGEDFLSPCLMEADLMRRVLPQDKFAPWLSAFLPGIPRDGNADWLTPGVVIDATDGKLVHLDGLNLSRAWALQAVADALPVTDRRRAALIAAANVHQESGLNSIDAENYAGGHWLASFATYLSTKRGAGPLMRVPPEVADQPK